MNKREAKRAALRYLASRAEHGAADADPALPDEDNAKIADALEELAAELYRRAGER
jgi:DNA-directed RNA polymerase subunit K/omega